MWEAIFIILLVVEAVLTFFFVRSFIKSKKANSETVGYFISILILGYIIYLIPFFYNQLVVHSNDNILIGLLSCLLGSIKMFAFDYLSESMKGFIAIYPIYGVVFTMGSLLAMFTTVLATLSFFYISFINHRRLNKCLKQRNCDIVIGLNEYSLDFIREKEYKIIWPTKILKKEDLALLVDDGYIIINKKLDYETIMSKLFKNYATYHFYHMYENEDEEVYLINLFKKIINEGYINKYLHLDMYTTKVEVFTKKLKNEGLSKNIDVFSINKITAKEVCEQYPLIKYLQSDIFDFSCATLKEDKTINVFILGFDGTNIEILKQLISHNQFVTVENNRFVNSPITYHIIDKGIHDEDIQLLSNIKILNQKIKDNPDMYFAAMDNIAKFKIYNHNPLLTEAIDLIKSYCNNENSFNYFYISLGNKYRNVIFAESLINELSDMTSNFHILCNSSSKDYINDDFNPFISFYGDYIENLDKAKERYKIYSHYMSTYKFIYSGEMQKTQDYNMEITSENYEFLYNYFDNIRHILNSIGYDYICKDKVDDKEVLNYSKYKYLMQKFDVKLSNVQEFIDNFKYIDYPTLTKSLLYQQHLRWCASSIVNGFKPMSKETYFRKKKTKDRLSKENIYLTSFDDLENVKEFLSSIRNMDKECFDICIYEAIFIYYLPQMLDGAGLVAYKIK